MEQPLTVNWLYQKTWLTWEESQQRLKQLREADFSAEEFFYNFGRIWRMKGRPEFMKLLASVDVHAPAKLRVNVQVPNFDDFFTTYDVKEGDGMWRSPEERVIIW